MSFRDIPLVGMAFAAILSFFPVTDVSAGSDDEISIRVIGTADDSTTAYLELVALTVVDGLPQRFLDGLLDDHAITIRVKELNRELTPSDFCGDNGKVFGSFDRRRRVLVVDSKLVELARANPTPANPDFGCNHQTYAGTLKATIVHELGHMYDRRHRTSSSTRFEALTGGETRFHLFRKNKVRNFNYASSPDTYEFRNREEAFAVNLEYYSLDADYRCARPAYTDFFDTIFSGGSSGGSSGVSSKGCDARSSVLLHSHVVEDNLNRTASISADRVYQVHYLFASSGSSMASRFGHGMVRLVTCAPSRDTVGPECLNDSAHHLVLSYRANVADLTINYVKGLFGAYPSQLFVYELPEIIKEYTRVEFRDLISVPLDLTRPELESFLDIALERYWSYEGKYYFVTNHCGTEVYRHLEATQGALARGIDPRTPKRILKSLPRTTLLDEALYEEIVSSDSANTFVFESKRPQYELALEEARAVGLYPNMSLADVLKKSDASDRQQQYTSLFAMRSYSERSIQDKRSLIAHLMLLERLLVAREQKSLGEEVVRVLLKGDDLFIEKLREELGGLFAKPWELVDDGGYGVPDDDAIRAYISSANERNGERSELYASLRDYEPVREIMESLDRLGSVRQLLARHLVTASMPRSASAEPLPHVAFRLIEPPQH